MATETATGLSGHLRGVTVTTLACLAGVGAAVIHGVLVGTDPAAAADRRTIGVLAAFVLVQFPTLRAVGIDVTEFGIKDTLHSVFMTLVL